MALSSDPPGDQRAEQDRDTEQIRRLVLARRNKSAPCTMLSIERFRQGDLTGFPIRVGATAGPTRSGLDGVGPRRCRRGPLPGGCVGCSASNSGDGQLVAELAAMAAIWPLGVTWMRLGLASSALGTRMRSTPSSIEALTSSASTWAGRVIARRKAPEERSTRWNCSSEKSLVARPGWSACRPRG